jgi:predicted RNA binding protein YcfA (HicA-like mRNA interferase family)
VAREHLEGGASMSQVTRKTVEGWLLGHGFIQEPGKASGHRQFAHAASGCKITLPGHGPPELSKKHVALILRALERAGFQKDVVREELRA